MSAWPAADRVALAEHLFASVPDDGAESDFGLGKETWREIHRRIDSVEAGTARMIPGEEGLKWAEGQLSARRQG